MHRDPDPHYGVLIARVNDLLFRPLGRGKAFGVCHHINDVGALAGIKPHTAIQECVRPTVKQHQRHVGTPTISHTQTGEEQPGASSKQRNEHPPNHARTNLISGPANAAPVQEPRRIPQDK